ncbi:hypothetical protein [Variovorax paradoxus]|nr:hypothetical protein [Variovorax paradoxus]
MTYVKLVWPHLRAPASQRSQDAATEFEVPYTRELWPLINSILTLAAKGDPAGILDPQIGRYVKRRQEFSPNFGCKTAFKAVASFFDDIFHPAIGRLRHPLRYFAQAQIQIYSAEMKRFGDFYRNEIEQPNIERYLATLNDYFKHFDQFRQMLVHARVGDNEVDDFVVGSKSFNEIKLYYGQAYETLTSSYLTLACINNVAQGRPYDEFQSMTLSKYTKDLEKSKRSNPFKETPELAAFIRFEDSSLRNGSHHASIWRDGEIVKYKSGGTGAERDISYSRYLHQCNEITIALAALLLVELQMFSRLRPS